MASKKIAVPHRLPHLRTCWEIRTARYALKDDVTGYCRLLWTSRQMWSMENVIETLYYVIQFAEEHDV